MFVLPAGPHAIIGTTEHPAHRGPDDIRATEQDVTYLLRNVNALLPGFAADQGRRHRRVGGDSSAGRGARRRPLGPLRLA